MNDFDTLISCCSEFLVNEEAAQDARLYVDSRLPRSAQASFGIGWFPSNHKLKLLESYLTDAQLSALDIIYDRTYYNGDEFIHERHASFENHNLVMPYRNAYGEIVGIVGRSILNDSERAIAKIPKYKNTSFEKRANLFGLFEGKKSIVRDNCCYIVEGQFDVIAAHNKEMCNVVALGSSAMSFEQVSLLLRYTKNFIVLLDNDEAGRVGADKIARQYSSLADIKVGHIPEGYKDLYDLVRENNIDDVRKMIG
jgi:DNA primase catalytic core